MAIVITYERFLEVERRRARVRAEFEGPRQVFPETSRVVRASPEAPRLRTLFQTTRNALKALRRSVPPAE
jgi:hypothetical protein